MSISIRQAHAGDEQRLGLIAAATFGFACPPDQTAEGVRSFVTSQLSPDKFAGYLADSTRTLLLAENDGVPVGYSMLIRGAATDPDVAQAIGDQTLCELSKFYVFSGLHGRGLASELMSATIARAHEGETAGVWLGVNKQNDRANRFYEKHGFRIVGSKTFPLGDRVEDDYVRELVFR